MFMCHLCDKLLKTRGVLNRHYREVHEFYDYNKVKQDQSTVRHNLKSNPRITCSLCKSVFGNLKCLEVHFQEQHKINLKKTVLSFCSAADFYSWKENTEEKDNSFYVKNTGQKVRSSGKISYYQCNRSGYFEPISGKRKKEVKVQGSCKINGFCPSTIKAKFLEDGNVEVEYCETHVGHTCDLAHKTLTLNERQLIAGKISNKIPFDTILEEVRSTLKPDSLKRIHLLTKQDLYNIEKEFGLNESIRHSNDAISVEAWVQGQQAENDCVLLYKPQGIDETATFAKNDFALAIMTEAQRELLKKFGSDCICIDSTHGLGAYDFEVVTVMVIDDMRQGFPCAFFITNRTDKSAVSEFLSAIREKVGTINPNAFMSDMAESFYNAWKEVMGPVDKRLFCTWHVDRAWQKNLSKIKDCDKRKVVYKKLRVLLEETDPNAFLAMLQPITDQLCSDQVTKEYGDYFKEHYGSNYHSWAYCFRVNVGLNTNMHLESMHKTIKHSILGGKNVKRLDKAISAIMQLIRQKLFDRLIIIEKGKLTSKIKILRNRHTSSLSMNPDLIVKSETLENSWTVGSSNSAEMYTIRKIKEDCPCRIICQQCKVCIHKFKCSCIDACIKSNMCKHVHLLCRKLMSEDRVLNHDELGENMGEVTSFEERKSLLAEVSAKTELPQKVRPTDKLLLRECFESVLNTIDCPDSLKVANQCLKNLKAKLLSIKHKNIALQVKRKNRIVKIEPQRRLFSTKNKKKKKLRTLRPTQAEAQKITVTALLGSGVEPSTSHQ